MPATASRNARVDRPYSLVVAATGYALPEERVDNREFARRSRSQFSAIDELAEQSATRARRWCAPHETAWTLAHRACLDAFSRCPDLLEEIDVVIAVSSTILPALHPCEPENAGNSELAPLVLRDVLRRDCLSIDLKGNCSGFLRALEVMDGLLAVPGRRAGLIVCAEQASRLATAETNRSSFSFIAADAAGTMVLQRRVREPGTAVEGLLDYCGTTHVNTLDLAGVGPDGNSIVMKGSTAAAAVGSAMIRQAQTLLDRNALSVADIDWFVPLQGHRRMVASVSEALGFPEAKVLWNAQDHGFSGSASIPATLAELTAAGTIRERALVLATATGAGLHSAAALLRL